MYCEIPKYNSPSAIFKTTDNQKGEISIMTLPAIEATLSNHTHAFILSELIKQLVQSGTNSSKTHINPFEIK